MNYQNFKYSIFSQESQFKDKSNLLLLLNIFFVFEFNPKRLVEAVPLFF